MFCQSSSGMVSHIFLVIILSLPFIFKHCRSWKRRRHLICMTPMTMYTTLAVEGMYEWFCSWFKCGWSSWFNFFLEYVSSLILWEASFVVIQLRIWEWIAEVASQGINPSFLIVEIYIYFFSTGHLYIYEYDYKLIHR